MRHIAVTFAILIAFAIPGAAVADTIAVSAVPTFTIVPSADTLTLDAGSTTFTDGTPVVIQTGTFHQGHSGDLVQLVPFSFVESITIDGITESVTVTGQDDVTIAMDTIEINAVGPISFGSETLSIDSFSIGSTTLIDLPFELTATITGSSAVPEPGTLGLMATGLLGAMGAIRRRLAACDEPT